MFWSSIHIKLVKENASAKFKKLYAYPTLNMKK
jgi:hypothetical protein